MVAVADPRPPTGRCSGGLRAATAASAGKHRTTRPGERERARAQQRLPVKMRQQLLDAIYDGQSFRTVLRDLGLTSNQVWGLTKPDQNGPSSWIQL